jgi:nucleoid-associated protein YgaU
MFDASSRYASIETAFADVAGPDGETRPVRYVRRRFIPQPGDSTTLVEHTVTQGERLDLIAARYLGDPLQFWRVADANNAIRPEELTEEPGRALRIGLPGI